MRIDVLTTPPYQVNDSNPIDTIPEDTLVERIRSQGDSLSKFAKKMDSANVVLKIFLQQPDLEHVHIIVKVPDTGECE